MAPTLPSLRSEVFKPCVEDKDLAFCLNEGECSIIETVAGVHRHCRWVKLLLCAPLPPPTISTHEVLFIQAPDRWTVFLRVNIIVNMHPQMHWSPLITRSATWGIRSVCAALDAVDFLIRTTSLHSWKETCPSRSDSENERECGETSPHFASTKH